MKKLNPVFQLSNGTMKLITKEDMEAYYAASFEHVDPMVNYYTATTQTFTKQQIEDYINRIVDDESRYDFLIRNAKDEIIGEIVLNDIDWKTKLAGFRIALFSQKHCNAGIGKQTIQTLLQFAFELLQLHRIELEVFDYNKRAKHVYESCGFQVEGKKRDGLYLNNAYHDVYIMSILLSDYQSLQAQ